MKAFSKIINCHKLTMISMTEITHRGMMYHLMAITTVLPMMQPMIKRSKALWVTMSMQKSRNGLSVCTVRSWGSAL